MKCVRQCVCLCLCFVICTSARVHHFKKYTPLSPWIETKVEINDKDRQCKNNSMYKWCKTTAAEHTKKINNSALSCKYKAGKDGAKQACTQTAVCALNSITDFIQALN